MSFVASGQGSAEQELQIIRSSAFWPEIDPQRLRDEMRLDGAITGPRLLHAIVEAIAATNHELSNWRAARQSEGADALSGIAGQETIDGEPIHVHRYRRAVYCRVAAEFVDRFRSIDTTKAGHAKADELEPTVATLLRDARWAIADIQGRPRSVIELI